MPPEAGLCYRSVLWCREVLLDMNIVARGAALLTGVVALVLALLCINAAAPGALGAGVLAGPAGAIAAMVGVSYLVRTRPPWFAGVAVALATAVIFSLCWLPFGDVADLAWALVWFLFSGAWITCLVGGFAFGYLSVPRT